MAATIGLVQNDIKKVLAYSTVSQLGYMFVAMGVGAFAAGIFHLFTHAFFKALLFLGSGAVIHALAGEQDMRKMGGLRKDLPVTYWTFLVGALAIAGVPLLSGFFSKDEILYRAYASGHWYLWFFASVASLLTALLHVPPGVPDVPRRAGRRSRSRRRARRTARRRRRRTATCTTRRGRWPSRSSSWRSAPSWRATSACRACWAGRTGSSGSSSRVSRASTAGADRAARVVGRRAGGGAAAAGDDARSKAA